MLLLQVSRCHDFIVSSTNRSCLTQKFVDEMNDPDRARRLTEERISNVEKERVRAGKNEEGVKTLAEEERVRAEESRKNEDSGECEEVG